MEEEATFLYLQGSSGLSNNQKDMRQISKRKTTKFNTYTCMGTPHTQKSQETPHAGEVQGLKGGLRCIRNPELGRR